MTDGKSAGEERGRVMLSPHKCLSLTDYLACWMLTMTEELLSTNKSCGVHMLAYDRVRLTAISLECSGEEGHRT